MSKATAKIKFRLFGDIGASIVELSLIISLIALIALPSVRKVGILNACKICHFRYCKNNSQTMYCSGAAQTYIWGSECVDNYITNGWEDWCNSGAW